jgi:DNA-binding response OmpR family regulator
MKILVVDDDKSLSKVITTFLQSRGFECKTVGNPENIKEQIDKFKPDLILMDLMMPKVDGLSALKSIKNDEKYQNIPVIIMSAKNYKATILSCITAGAYEFIEKPFTMSILYDKIQNALKAA